VNNKLIIMIEEFTFLYLIQSPIAPFLILIDFIKNCLLIR